MSNTYYNMTAPIKFLQISEDEKVHIDDLGPKAAGLIPFINELRQQISDHQFEMYKAEAALREMIQRALASIEEDKKDAAEAEKEESKFDVSSLPAGDEESAENEQQHAVN